MPRLRLAGEADQALMIPMSERGETAAVVVLVRAGGQTFAAGDAGYCARSSNRPRPRSRCARLDAEAGPIP